MEFIGIIVTIVIVLVLVGVVVGMYNNLVKNRVRVGEAFSSITALLKRRADLLPNLMETVKGYASHEAGVFEAVTKARAATANADTPAQAAEADNMLSGALKSLFAVSEAYPQLQASANFLQLQDEISDTENKLLAGRRFYNNTVNSYNTSIQTFPSVIIARMFNFKEAEFFEVADRAAIEEPPTIKF